MGVHSQQKRSWVEDYLDQHRDQVRRYSVIAGLAIVATLLVMSGNGPSAELIQFARFGL